jgi:hypothetical protein
MRIEGPSKLEHCDEFVEVSQIWFFILIQKVNTYMHNVANA